MHSQLFFSQVVFTNTSRLVTLQNGGLSIPVPQLAARRLPLLDGLAN